MHEFAPRGAHVVNESNQKEHFLLQVDSEAVVEEKCRRLAQVVDEDARGLVGVLLEVLLAVVRYECVYLYLVFGRIEVLLRVLPVLGDL